MRSVCLPWILLLTVWPCSGSAQAPAEQEVTFQLSDALIKDKALPGVQIRLVRSVSSDAGPADPILSAETDAAGKLQAGLPAGSYLATYRKPGYVPIERTPVTIRAAGQVITTSLTPMLESGTGRQRIVRIVLNWGSDSSQVKDADAHAAREGAPGETEVYFTQKRHDDPAGWSIELDVDDVDWGGPETITLTEPTPGRYLYWVHNYSGGASLGESEVVVRVFIDDRLAGEYRAPAAAEDRYYRPFDAIRIDEDLSASVLDFDSQAVVASAHLAKPAGDWSDPTGMDCEDCDSVGVVVFIIVAVWIGLGFARRRR